MVEGEPKQTGEQPETEIVMESVKDHIYRDLIKTDPNKEPEKYLGLLDRYERVELRERQTRRREEMMEKLGKPPEFWKQTWM